MYSTVHLIYPLGFDTFSVKLPDINLYNLSCLTLSHQLSSLRKHKDEFKVYGEDNGVQYPVNLLRNVARKNAETNYVLVLDIDLIPSRSLRNDFLQFIKQNKNKVKLKDDTMINLDDRIAFVLPTYEMDVNVDNLHNTYEDEEKDKNDEFENNNDEFRQFKDHLGMNLGNIVGKNFGTNTIPTNRSSLLNLVRKKLIRPFYYELCFKCQKSTNYELWQTAENDDRLNALFEIFFQDPYEPFYIAMNSDSLPYYDERFKQYGFNRISQVCNLHVIGYRFLILNNHFLVHKGFKKHDKFHDGKDLELERNRQLFRQFKNELKLKYPNSPRRCY